MAPPKALPSDPPEITNITAVQRRLVLAGWQLEESRRFATSLQSEAIRRVQILLMDLEIGCAAQLNRLRAEMGVPHPRARKSPCRVSSEAVSA